VDRRRQFQIDSRHGLPDGISVDAVGNIWVALWGGGAVHCYDSAGALLEIVQLPVTQVTACTFGGEQLEDLFITTSREDISEASQPQAGSLFHVRPGVTGLPAAVFAG
jgi:sugar lactone lactonase YvrE